MPSFIRFWIEWENYESVVAIPIVANRGNFRTSYVYAVWDTTNWNLVAEELYNHFAEKVASVLASTVIVRRGWVTPMEFPTDIVWGTYTSILGERELSIWPMLQPGLTLVIHKHTIAPPGKARGWNAYSPVHVGVLRGLDFGMVIDTDYTPIVDLLAATTADVNFSDGGRAVPGIWSPTDSTYRGLIGPATVKRELGTSRRRARGLYYGSGLTP